MDSNLIPQEAIQNNIFFIRKKKVMLDRDLAMLYEVETKQLKRAVKRNIDRFPEDFMFELTKEEYKSLRYQFGTLKRGEHAKYLPYAFTEHGILMLSSVLNSEKAIQVNIQIMRTFTKMRELLVNYQEVKEKIKAIEKKYDYKFTINSLLMEDILRDIEKIKKFLTPPKKDRKTH